MNKNLQRELQVAFSRKSQPAWFRILKYVLLAGILYFLWQSKWFWAIISLMVIVSIAVHCWYRYKTKAWTQSYGGWKAEKPQIQEPSQTNQQE